MPPPPPPITDYEFDSSEISVLASGASLTDEEMTDVIDQGVTTDRAKHNRLAILRLYQLLIAMS